MNLVKFLQSFGLFTGTPCPVITSGNEAFVIMTTDGSYERNGLTVIYSTTDRPIQEASKFQNILCLLIRELLGRILKPQFSTF